MKWLTGTGVKTTFAILLTIVVPAVITLSVVKVPTQPLDFTLESAPYGYTVSLLIYLIPVLAMYVWFRRRYREPAQVTDDRRSAYRWTLTTLIPLGFLLDIFFGYAFFRFPNSSAILPLPLVPAFASDQPGLFTRYLPVEEFAFYALGFTAILSAYIWCDEYWLKAYNVPDYGEQAKAPLVQLELATPLTIAALLIGAGYLYKRFGPHDSHEGFPTYFTFLVVASLLPSLLFFRSTRAFVNWRAVSFAALWVVLTSLIWEATLAIPYGWWGYKEGHMLGLFIDAWSGLPFEASMLWLSVTFTTVTVYEMFKIRSAAKRLYGKGWWETFFGSPNTTASLRT
jgi:hypothetical protein